MPRRQIAEIRERPCDPLSLEDSLVCPVQKLCADPREGMETCGAKSLVKEFAQPCCVVNTAVQYFMTHRTLAR